MKNKTTISSSTDAGRRTLDGATGSACGWFGIWFWCDLLGHHQMITKNRDIMSRPPHTTLVCARCGCISEIGEKIHRYDRHGRLEAVI